MPYVLRIADQGPGLEPDGLERIFDGKQRIFGGEQRLFRGERIVGQRRFVGGQQRIFGCELKFALIASQRLGEIAL